MIVRPRVEDYALRHTTPEPPCLAAVAAETREVSAEPYMMVGPLEGRLLAMLVHMLRPALVLEVGTFTGYSALAMAGALPPHGRLITCEIDPRHAEIARRHVAASPWAGRVEVRLGPALDTIAALPGPVDLAFVDAHKTAYAEYYEALLPRLAETGVLAFDNTLHLGQVIAEDPPDEEIAAIRAFNALVRDDPRVEQVVLTVRQGLTLIRHAPQRPS
ncbi:O-methyltransferase [Bailinhaonella thermotolerans]|uniref:O-methyltransferase n=1 Tax=Bailinhaonella thermotolerans TaxID=1070861 RepID=UPI00192A6C51|nr:class I SAM-dependent methyltransferase [Bailinhaonella thermotolerans]